jgi:triphosphoribosyl-dephospho-CoA synthase
MHTTMLASNHGSEATHPRRSDHLAALATQALIAEAELTPKPGLVDRRGSGSHDDLSLHLLRRSATVLKPYFSAMAHFGVGRDACSALRQELATIGRDAERAMYEATNGSNAHKGAIWILGLLVAAAARRVGQSAKDIAAAAGAIARLPDRAQPTAITHGDITKMRYGVRGARGEAWDDFPHVIGFGLPTLRRQRAAGASEEVSRLDALLSIMARLDDTCVLYRGGSEALDLVKSGARSVLVAGGFGTAPGRNQMQKLECALIARRISPGGSADLLAATIFLDAVERRQDEVRQDHREWNEQTEWEERDGAA